MSLRDSEIAQCEACEEYLRLHELDDVVIDKNGDVKPDRKTKSIGKCPHCGVSVDISRVG